MFNAKKVALKNEYQWNKSRVIQMQKSHRKKVTILKNEINRCKDITELLESGETQEENEQLQSKCKALQEIKYLIKEDLHL